MTLFSAYTVDFVNAFCRSSQTEFCNRGVSVAVQIYEPTYAFSKLSFFTRHMSSPFVTWIVCTEQLSKPGLHKSQAPVCRRN